VAAQLDALDAYRRRGVELHVVGRGRIEIESEAGFLLTLVEGGMAEAFRRSVSRKTKDALARLRATGTRAGNVRYGYQLAPDQRTLVPCPEELAILQYLRARRAEGLSYCRIARELNAAGIATRGGGRWWTETVRSILAHADNDRAVVVNEAVA
jgi:DNA invertase Pin-like site-specific DNA recombinase